MRTKKHTNKLRKKIKNLDKYVLDRNQRFKVRKWRHKKNTEFIKIRQD